MPRTLNARPDDWRASYADLAAECGLNLTDLDAAFSVLTASWQTLLEEAAD